MIDPDDPKWTAYVLDELAAAERAECEHLLQVDPDARAHVASLREAIGMIESELHTQPAPAALDDLQRRRIHNAATESTTPPKKRRRWLAVGGSMAASLAVVVTAGVVLRSSDSADAVHRAEVEGSYAAKSQVRAIEGLERELHEQAGQALRSDLKSKGRMPVTATPVVTGAQPGPGLYFRADGQLAEADNRHTTEAYDRIDDNPFHKTTQEPRSTFSVDVDTASYSNVRRFLEGGSRPPKDAVRIEEMINYFRYEYPRPTGTDPFSISTEVGPSPWNDKHQLVKIGLQAPPIDSAQVAARNLVFLIDTSGSMSSPNKLPLVKQSLAMLVESLREQDQISIVAYAGAAGLVLPPTSGHDKEAIRQALTRLEAGGSTNGGEGIQLAYRVAAQHLKKGGINRVILCSDGDYNVGITNEGDLTRLIERERERGIFLTVLGYGRGNFKDATMEKLADRGNGNYAYIDSAFEAKKVLVTEAGATLVTVAKDVKLQVEFNPSTVAGFRLIGYENRVLAHRDFNDDKKDAGDIGAGHSVTAIYEIVPAGVEVPSPKVDDLKYQTPTAPSANANELMTIKLRYKAPADSQSKLLSRVVDREQIRKDLQSTSIDYKWTAAIAGFGMLLRDSPHRGNLTWQQVQGLAMAGKGVDAEGYRAQAIGLINKAAKLAPTTP
jgi:Ca-activated chloride channel family protein